MSKRKQGNLLTNFGFTKKSKTNDSEEQQEACSSADASLGTTDTTTTALAGIAAGESPPTADSSECTHTRPSGRGRWPFSHLAVLNWPHCSLACTHTRPSGRGRWPSQLWPGHGRLLYIRHHVVTRHHQASAAWTIIKSAASQSFNNNGQQHREHTNS